MPCTRSGHHAYMGGLVEHTVGTGALVQALATWHPRLDSDLLLCAALVHDIGHARAFRLGATFELTEEGRLLGHVAIGHEIVGDAARRVGLSAVRRAELLHVIDWHHGPPPGQAPGAAEPRGARAVAGQPAGDRRQGAPGGARARDRLTRGVAGTFCDGIGASSWTCGRPAWPFVGDSRAGRGYGCGRRPPKRADASCHDQGVPRMTRSSRRAPRCAARRRSPPSSRCAPPAPPSPTSRARSRTPLVSPLPRA